MINADTWEHIVCVCVSVHSGWVRSAHLYLYPFNQLNYPYLHSEVGMVKPGVSRPVSFKQFPVLHCDLQWSAV